MDKMKLQNDEFDAADRLAKNLVRLFNTPVVDDDYPEVRHGYESALRNLIDALKANGRIPDVAAPQPVEAEAVAWLIRDSTNRVISAITSERDRDRLLYDDRGMLPKWTATPLYTTQQPEQPAIDLEQFRPAVVHWYVYADTANTDIEWVRNEANRLLAIIDGAKGEGGNDE